MCGISVQEYNLFPVSPDLNNFSKFLCWDVAKYHFEKTEVEHIILNSSISSIYKRVCEELLLDGDMIDCTEKSLYIIPLL